MKRLVNNLEKISGIEKDVSILGDKEIVNAYFIEDSSLNLEENQLIIGQISGEVTFHLMRVTRKVEIISSESFRIRYYLSSYSESTFANNFIKIFSSEEILNDISDDIPLIFEDNLITENGGN